MLNGNMVAETSKRGLLVRVGRGQHARALARADAKPMELLLLRKSFAAAVSSKILTLVPR
jgi:hypothetical protein